MKKENNIQEISFDEIEQINGAVVDPVTVAGVIVAAVGVAGGLFAIGYQIGKDLASQNPPH